MLARLKDDQGLCWPVASLRKAVADVAAGIDEHRQDAQVALSRPLTALVTHVLPSSTGPLPRLVYNTDGGSHQTQHYRRVLR